MSRESGAEDCGTQTESDLFDPQWISTVWSAFGEHGKQGTMLREDRCASRSSDERERPIDSRFDGRIELTDEVSKDAGRKDKHRAAVTAVGRMTDPVSGAFREEHGLVQVSRHATTPEVLLEHAVPQEHDCVPGRFFFSRWRVPWCATGVIAHLHDWAQETPMEVQHQRAEGTAERVPRSPECVSSGRRGMSVAAS